MCFIKIVQKNKYHLIRYMQHITYHLYVQGGIKSYQLRLNKDIGITFVLKSV